MGASRVINTGDSGMIVSFKSCNLGKQEGGKLQLPLYMSSRWMQTLMHC